MLLPGDRTLISHAADGAGIDPARISFTRAGDGIRSPHQRLRMLSPDGLAEETADLAVEITHRRNLVPNAPAAATSARPSPPAAGTRPANPARPPG